MCYIGQQDGGVEDVRSPLLTKIPRSQLTAEQPSSTTTTATTKRWNLPKRYPTCKDKEEATMRWYEGHNCDKIKSHTRWVGNPQTGKYLYHRSSPIGVKVLSPTSGFPAWGSGNRSKRPQRSWL